MNKISQSCSVFTGTNGIPCIKKRTATRAACRPPLKQQAPHHFPAHERVQLPLDVLLAIIHVSTAVQI